MTSNLVVAEAQEVPQTPGPKFARGISTHRVALSGPIELSCSRLLPPTNAVPGRGEIRLTRSVLSEERATHHFGRSENIATFPGLYKWRGQVAEKVKK
ncbi:hypothetical protein LEMLEM_LOCUS6952 [Lemmus lemmus]